MKKSIILTNEKQQGQRVFDAEMRELIKAKTEYLGEFTKDEFLASVIKDVQVVFSTWGMQHYTEEEISEYFPKCEAIYYAAGSVQGFAREFLNKGIGPLVARCFTCSNRLHCPSVGRQLQQRRSVALSGRV